MLIAVTFFAFTSCQKEQISVPVKTEATNAADQAIPEKEENTDPKLKIETQGIGFQENLFTTEISSPRVLKQMAHSRSPIVFDDVVLCGDNLWDTNKGKGNGFNGSVYVNQGCLSTNYGFLGEDASYLLWVEDAGGYDIQLSNVSVDLDIFLFSLKEDGSLGQCLGYSIQGGTSKELISVGLDLGIYALIVDAPYTGTVSDYALSITCAVVSNLELCDYFDAYNNGAAITNNYDWIKYLPHSGDGYISNARGLNSTQSLYCDDDTDIVNLIGKEYKSGVHYLSWAMYVPSGKSGAFIFEKYAQPGKENSIRVFMRSNGKIDIYAKGQLFHSPFTYKQNQWVDIDVTYSLNQGQCALSIDGNHIANFSATVQALSSSAGQKRLAGINFWGFESNSEFYIDDLCRMHTNPFGETSSTTMQTLNIHPDN